MILLLTILNDSCSCVSCCFVREVSKSLKVDQIRTAMCVNLPCIVDVQGIAGSVTIIESMSVAGHNQLGGSLRAGAGQICGRDQGRPVRHGLATVRRGVWAGAFQRDGADPWPMGDAGRARRPRGRALNRRLLVPRRMSLFAWVMVLPAASLDLVCACLERHGPRYYQVLPDMYSMCRMRRQPDNRTHSRLTI